MSNSANQDVLLQKAKDGDTKSLEQLFECFKPMVNSIARQHFLVGGDTEDLIQEGMIGLNKAIWGYDKNENTMFSTYAHICVKRQIENAIRKSKTNKNRPLNESDKISNQGMLVLKDEQEDDEESGIFLTDENPSPEEIFFEREQRQELAKAIKGILSEFEFNVLYFYLKGFSYIDIAQKVKKDSKSIDNAVTRIKKKLQTAYKEGKICI